jgi:PAS domain S-box-containing protein
MLACMSADSHQKRLFDALGNSPIAMVVSNPRRSDNPLELANPAFCQLTGYDEDEIVGRNCRFLTGSGTDPADSQKLRDAIRYQRPVLTEIVNYRRDGRTFRNGVMITPLFGPDGRVEWFLGSQVDLGDVPACGLDRRRADADRRVSLLPPRQRQVLGLMARGLLNKQMAWELKISEKTVKMHRALLLDRLAVSTSAEAIRIAVEAGL